MAGIRPGQARGPWVGSVIAANEVTGGVNVGTGSGQVFKDRLLHDLRFRTLLEGESITITTGTNEVTIAVKSWLEPVIEFYDNSYALPVGPLTGDRYVAMSTANGWTADYVYEWNGSAWIGHAPVEGDVLYDKDTDLLYNYTGALWSVIRANPQAHHTTHEAGGADVVNSIVYGLSDTSPVAVDASLADTFRITITASRQFQNPTNPVSGKKIIFRVKQGGAGSNLVTWDTKYRFSTDLPAPVASTAVGATDYFGFMYHEADDKWDYIAEVKGF